MSEPNKLPPPVIGWIACQESFFLDGLKITTAEAYTFWRNGDATFMPNAAKRMTEIDAMPLIAAAMMMSENEDLTR